MVLIVGIVQPRMGRLCRCGRPVVEGHLTCGRVTCDERAASLFGGLDEKIEACRDAFRTAYGLLDELKNIGVCGRCGVGDHESCREYTCVCCGGGQ